MWYDKRLNKWRQKRIDRISIRIEQLTQAINGIDENYHPSIAAELVNHRTVLAFRRSNLIKKKASTK
jgi:hypothetical protein